MESHREVVNLFVDAVNRRSAEGYAAIESEQYREAAVQPWVHSRSGCLDQSGRRKFGAKSRTAQSMQKTLPSKSPPILYSYFDSSQSGSAQ